MFGNFTTVSFAVPALAQGPGRRTVNGHRPAAAVRVKPVQPLAETNLLNLVIGLPLRQQARLTGLLQQLYEPTAANFHHWLTPAQFTQLFGPTEQDYLKVIDFAQAHGLTVTGQHSNRAYLDVAGTVAAIEKAFRVKLFVYPHPNQNRTFYAPDTEPSVEWDVPILHISGLENFTVPEPLGLGFQAKASAAGSSMEATPYWATGSGPNGDFMGKDFRAAYAPGVTNTGAGQYIAIVDLGGAYYPNDLYLYETNAGFSTNTMVTNILLSGFTNLPSGPQKDLIEEVMDIDLAICMAPGAAILNYEGEAHDVFNQIAMDNKARQITLSWGIGLDDSIIQTFQQFAAQGQALSQASGDSGAETNGGVGMTGNPYATIVGGTDLVTDGAGGPWETEAVWQGSGGGVSGYAIPDWQLGVANSANQASAVYRNYPDVSMPGVNVFIYEGAQAQTVGGTSASSPLWAGVMALVNEQAASEGKPAAGFINPAIYRIGLGPAATYTNCFHDITIGNNFSSGNPTNYLATTGYDLCTGWGTPSGSNTIIALADVGTNDFTLSASPAMLSIVRGQAVAATISVTRMNGLSGAIDLSISNLPSGVGAVFNSPDTASSNLLTLTVSNGAAIGPVTATITGRSGDLTHSIDLNLDVLLPIPGSEPASLASCYNRAGIYTDGRTFTGGLDGAGSAYSANLLGPSLSWNEVVFELGPANVPDAIAAAGQTISLPAGQFTSLLLLGTAVNGSQSNQSFTVTYTDNSTVAFKQGFSDWYSPANFSGESKIMALPYRALGNGAPDNRTFYLYGYLFTLDETKTVKSFTLPHNDNVLVLAISLADEPAPASLTSYFNRAGIFTDGAIFTNPPTAGLDGGGYAYSATLLGGSQIWSNILFNLGPANAPDVISATGQTLMLPAGRYSVLRLLATGVNGTQGSQPFIVAYSDGTTNTYVQSLSDWSAPQDYEGESTVSMMGYRNNSHGIEILEPAYLYGYSFNLDGAKSLRSLQLPNDENVVVLAVSVIPDWRPVFDTDPVVMPGIMAGQAFSGTLALSAVDLNGAPLTFAKVSGPDWLNVAADGALSGTPLSADEGTNSFVVSATDPGSLSGTATALINVSPAPPIIPSLFFQGSSLLLNWTGGIAPYQVQVSTNLSDPLWKNAGGSTNGNSLTLRPGSGAMFYRIVGQ